MNLRNRRVRVGLILGLAVAILYVAWRLGPGGGGATCTPGREEIRDDSGRVVEIVRKACR